jgi:IS5 family transposase
MLYLLMISLLGSDTMVMRFVKLNCYISGRRDPYTEKKDEEEDDDASPSDSTDEGEKEEESEEESEEVVNSGTLILDATCVPQDICYPTDFGLLNKAREALEAMIDSVYPTGEKPRTYRRVARRDYLRYVRNRKPTRKQLRTSLRKQLNYVRRDLGYLSDMKDRLSEKDRERLGVIEQLYAQQKEMYDKRTSRVDDRIVSLHEPWVRPIVRGKSKAPAEFGAKLAVSVVDGYMRVEQLSWDAFHEGKTLKESVEHYRADTGKYPERILDSVYTSQARMLAQIAMHRTKTAAMKPSLVFA